MNKVLIDPITRPDQEVVQPNAEAEPQPHARPTSTRKWVFLRPEGATSGTENEFFSIFRRWLHR